jgi:hypothetical protein
MVLYINMYHTYTITCTRPCSAAPHCTGQHQTLTQQHAAVVRAALLLLLLPPQHGMQDYMPAKQRQDAEPVCLPSRSAATLTTPALALHSQPSHSHSTATAHSKLCKQHDQYHSQHHTRQQPQHEALVAC